MSYNKESDLGFRDVKAEVLTCLDEGTVLHAERANIDIKNLLAVGEVTLDEVTAVIGRARGTDYSCSPHHTVASVDVHVIRTTFCGKKWYIKWYFLEPDSVFISVHH